MRTYIPEPAALQNEKEVKLMMCQMMREMHTETGQKAALSTARQIARRLLLRGKDTCEEIAEITMLPIEEIKSMDEAGSADL